MVIERGFTAYYRRRLLTPLEHIDKLCLEVFAKEFIPSSEMHRYFKDTHLQHQAHFPRYWGAGDAL
jgi:hypothetical protein